MKGLRALRARIVSELCYLFPSLTPYRKRLHHLKESLLGNLKARRRGSRLLLYVSAANLEDISQELLQASDVVDVVLHIQQDTQGLNETEFNGGQDVLIDPRSIFQATQEHLSSHCNDYGYVGFLSSRVKMTVSEIERVFKRAQTLKLLLFQPIAKEDVQAHYLEPFEDEQGVFHTRTVCAEACFFHIEELQLCQMTFDTDVPPTLQAEVLWPNLGRAALYRLCGAIEAVCTPAGPTHDHAALIPSLFETYRLKRQHIGFYLRHKNGSIEVEAYGDYECRNTNTQELIAMAIERFQLADFDWIEVVTDDHEVPNKNYGIPVFRYATRTNDFSQICPDFAFLHWRETGLDDYEETRKALIELGKQPPETTMLGWRGNVMTHENRQKIVQKHDGKTIDARSIYWKKRADGTLRTKNFMSLPEQVQAWRYLIDVEGVGWSARLKLFFFSNRVVFLQERPMKEWYFPLMTPWKEYVPVRRDLGDLHEALARIQSDPELERSICAHALEFANTHLTRDSAICRWGALLQQYAPGLSR